MADKKNEFAFIEQIKKIVAPSGKPASLQVQTGIGDDAAVVTAPNLPLLFCSDAMVENTHFSLDWSQPEEIGHKALASCLSDIAAMNGQPLYALVSLALRPGLADEFVERFYSGLQALAERTNTIVVGGDTVASQTELFIDVSLIGCSPRPITRSGAKVGDLVAVTGILGSAHGALTALQAGNARNEIPRVLLDALLKPNPRFDVLTELSEPGLVTSLIDISDGLASELHHLARASACGFLINEYNLPIDPATRILANRLNECATTWAWSGGEDYQLLMTLDRTIWENHRPHLPIPPVTIIGEVRPQTEGLLRRRQPPSKKTAANTSSDNSSGDFEPFPNTGWKHQF